MKRATALLDANVLYPAPLRDLLLQLAAMSLFRARWSARIHDEWINTLLAREPRRKRETLERTRRMMDDAISDSLVTGYERFIKTLQLPDPNDRHVLAAAIKGRCDLIVTFNLKDFPPAALKQHRVRAIHPDMFLADFLRGKPEQFLVAIRTIRSRLRSPPVSAPDYLAILTQQRLRNTSTMLRPYISEF